jgi:hypothetical protein
LGLAVRGFPEKTIEAENQKINDSRTSLLSRKAKLELNIEQAQSAQDRIKDIKQACEMVSQNLNNLTYEEKRLALEALNIKVWADNHNLSLEGVLPVTIVSQPSYP